MRRVKVCGAPSVYFLVTSTQRKRRRLREGGRRLEIERGFWGRPKYKSVCLSHSHNLQAYQSVLRVCPLNFFSPSDYNSSATLTFYPVATEGCSLEGGYTPAEHFHLGKFKSQADNFSESLWMGSIWGDFYASSWVTHGYFFLGGRITFSPQVSHSNLHFLHVLLFLQWQRRILGRFWLIESLERNFGELLQLRT